MLDDIFANNEKRLRNLRSHYSAETVAAMVNDRLNEKNIKETVTGSEIDGFLKVSRLGRNKALVPISAYTDAINMDALPTT
ncbi:hypothetical protein HJ053_00050 [Vibrio parahaemolyticus]|nr:hypothetical protein [Vibrio parahaemolyticus]